MCILDPQQNLHSEAFNVPGQDKNMSAPGGAPSPVPRSGSIGPGSGIAMPTQQQMSSGPSGGGPPGTGGAPPGGMSQQNLNQIVC